VDKLWKLEKENSKENFNHAFLIVKAPPLTLVIQQNVLCFDVSVGDADIVKVLLDEEG